MGKKVFFLLVGFLFFISHNSMVAMYPQPYLYNEPDLEQPKELTLEEEVSAIKSELSKLNRKLEGGRFCEQYSRIIPHEDEREQKIDDLLKQINNVNGKLDNHHQTSRFQHILTSGTMVILSIAIFSLHLRSYTCNCEQ